MKTRILISVIFSVLSIVSLSANERVEKKSNDTVPVKHIVKEINSSKRERQLDDKKIICEKNEYNQVVERMVYLADSEGEWVLNQIYQYSYSSKSARIPSSLSYVYWNKYNGKWDKTHIVYSKE